MKSKTRFFSKGLSANLLKRCWPIWVCYLCFLLLMTPGALLNTLQETHAGNAAEVVRMNVLNTGCYLAVISFAVAIVVVMAMFSFLYNARTCGMLCSMPLKRETVFTTAYLTGLVPLLAADLITAAVTFLLFREYLSLETMALWLSLALMGNVTFYGFAAFCAMLTGSLFILPLAYAALSFAAFVAEGALRGLLGVLVYGFTYSTLFFGKLSPVMELLIHLEVSVKGMEEALPAYGAAAVFAAGENTQYVIRDYSTLFVYFLCGILFSAAALWLYKRRNMEYAGDTVAFPVLKPIFKYCMAVGTSLVLACFVAKEIFSATGGMPLVIITAVLMLLGAFAGYFAAEMLIQKTMHVFRGTWKGLLVLWALALLFIAGCRADITGYSRYVPEEEEVASVQMLFVGSSMELKTQENIAAASSLHRQILSEQKKNETAGKTCGISLSYMLKNGKTLSRMYTVSADEAALADDASSARAAEALANTPEAVTSRYTPEIMLTENSIWMAMVEKGIAMADGSYILSGDNMLTPAQMMELYEQCIIPDIADGTLGKIRLDGPEEREYISLSLHLIDEEEHGYYYWRITPEAKRTTAWIEANTALRFEQSAA